MEPKKDYYEVLGVARDADQRTIKRAFLKLARTLHPDVNKEPDAEVRFKEVNEAYSVLSDERKRANYDQFGNPDGPGGFGSDFVDMSDIFGGGFGGMGDIFESFFGGGGRGGAAARTRGRDMSITLRITLAEAAAGVSKTIAYDRLAPCDDCNGTGVAEGGHETTCERCHGRGTVVEVQRTIFGQMQCQSTCPVCHGSGRVVDNPCDTCQGEGRTPSHETVKVDIPHGIRSGQSIRVDGRGEAGVRGDASGNLVVTVQVLEDERFERQGDDLIHIVDVDAIDAILGCEVEFDGILEGERLVAQVPAGCQYGQQVELRGSGMPRLGTSARGNMIVVVRVNVPSDIADEEAVLLRRVRDLRAHARSQREGQNQNEGTTNAQKDAAQSKRAQHRGKTAGKATGKASGRSSGKARRGPFGGKR